MKYITFIFGLIFIMHTHAQEYQSEWSSLLEYEAPEWYEDAKLGFWPIWGVFSVPAFKGNHAAEWYGRWMYCKEGQSSRNNQGLATHLHHKKVYGNPSEFGYKDLIPLWKAEKFDADDWVELCEQGGAKFMTSLAVFHDGINLWNSPTHRWNSVAMGPKIDVVGLLSKAAKKRGMKFGVSNHSAWNYGFYQWNHINQYDAKDRKNQDLYGSPIYPEGLDTVEVGKNESRASFFKRTRWLFEPSETDLDRWLERTKEVTRLYKPDLHYFDWGMNSKIFESRRKEFGAYYYNKAVEWKKGSFGKPNVVINYKREGTFADGSAVRDFEHGAFDDINHMVWQTDESIYYGHNWGYAEGVKIKPTNMIVDQLMDIISKRGVLMLAIAPKADGTFPESQKKFLKELGGWLKVCGEAVYETRPYVIFGEIGNQWLEKDVHGLKTYKTTKEDIRFTRNKNNNILYATALEWPGETLQIKSLAGVELKDLKYIKLIGFNKKLKWKQTSKGLMVYMPKKPNYDFAYPVRLEFNNMIPSIK